MALLSPGLGVVGSALLGASLWLGFWQVGEHCVCGSAVQPSDIGGYCGGDVVGPNWPANLECTHCANLRAGSGIASGIFLVSSAGCFVAGYRQRDY